MSSAAEMLSARLTAAHRQIEAYEAVVEAVRAAGPFPMTFEDCDGFDVCCHCRYVQHNDPTLPTHSPTCPGVAIANALAHLDGSKP